MKSRLSCMVAVVGMALASMSAHAAVDWTWTLNSAPTGSNLPGATSVEGYSASSNTTALVAASATSALPELTWYSGSGFGICSSSPSDPSCSSPNHAVDNSVGKESIVLSFQNKVNLSWLDIGWSYNDSDLSVLAYTGAGVPTLAGSKYSSLLSNGWSLVGQYANVATSTSLTSPSLNLGTALSSSYWMIAAYNSTFGGACTGGTCGDSNDYVKIFAVAGNTASNGKVSEPAALLLFSTAIVGIIGLRRRRPD